MLALFFLILGLTGIVLLLYIETENTKKRLIELTQYCIDMARIQIDLIALIREHEEENG
jgi:hypothetical protein